MCFSFRHLTCAINSAMRSVRFKHAIHLYESFSYSCLSLFILVDLKVLSICAIHSAIYRGKLKRASHSCHSFALHFGRLHCAIYAIHSGRLEHAIPAIHFA